MYIKNIKAVFREPSVRSIIVLIGGTSFAQLLGMLALPILTRLFTPEDFNVLAVFTSVVVLVSVAACLRFDIAVPLPDSEKEALGLLSLSMIFCLLTSFCVLLAVVVLNVFFVMEFTLGGIQKFLWMLPLVVLLMGFFSALQFWATRVKEFQGIARARVSQALACVAVQLALGVWGGDFGLVAGYCIGCFFGVLGLYKVASRGGFKISPEMDFKYLCFVFKKYKRYPKYSVLESIANSAGIQASIILIAALAAGPEAGFLMVAMKVLGIPMSLLGGAVGQVYLSEAPQAERVGTLAAYTERLTTRLMKVGVGPLVFLSIVAPTAFPYLFGGGWERAGELVLWMMPWFVFQFLASPVSMVMHVKKRQGSMLALTLFGLFIRLGGVVVGSLNGGHVSELYALASAVFYAICFWVFLTTAEVKGRDIVMLIFRSIHFPIAWALLGIALVFIWGRIIL